MGVSSSWLRFLVDVDVVSQMQGRAKGEHVKSVRHREMLGVCDSSCFAACSGSD